MPFRSKGVNLLEKNVLDKTVERLIHYLKIFNNVLPEKDGIHLRWEQEGREGGNDEFSEKKVKKVKS